jgi:hypothetical protein
VHEVREVKGISDHVLGSLCIIATGEKVAKGFMDAKAKGAVEVALQVLF